MRERESEAAREKETIGVGGEGGERGDGGELGRVREQRKRVRERGRVYAY